MRLFVIVVSLTYALRFAPLLVIAPAMNAVLILVSAVIAAIAIIAIIAVKNASLACAAPVLFSTGP